MPSGLMSGPPEARSQRCTNGCAMGWRENSYECRAQACPKDNLCGDCVFTCGDCADDFCADHVFDSETASENEMVYVCGPCLARRRHSQETNREEEKAA